MKWLFFLAVFLAMIKSSFGGDNPLSIRVIKTENSSSGNSTYILMSVENKSDQSFEYTLWSCVFFDKGEPVYEEESLVENIPPRGRAIKREIKDYGGPFDKIECRFMRSKPRAGP
jgi:hypothetical protein